MVLVETLAYSAASASVKRRRFGGVAGNAPPAAARWSVCRRPVFGFGPTHPAGLALLHRKRQVVHRTVVARRVHLWDYRNASACLASTARRYSSWSVAKVSGTTRPQRRWHRTLKRRGFSC